MSTRSQQDNHTGTWSVIEVDEFDSVINVFGSFQTKELAERYAKKALYLGRDSWDHKPVHYNNFVVAPWYLAVPEYR